MNGIKPSFNAYIPPVHYKSGDLSVPETGMSNFRHVYQLSPAEVRSQFKFSKMNKLGKAIKSFGTGFKSGAKKGLVGGAAVGAAFATVAAVIGALSFPPSALAIGVSIGLGALKFGIAGAVILGLGNGVRKFVSTAFHQFRASPEKLMAEEAAKGRKIVDTLVKKAMSGKQLTKKETQNLEYYQLWVPAWQKSSNFLTDYPKCNDVEQGQPSYDQTTPLCDLPGDIEAETAAIKAQEAKTGQPVEPEVEKPGEEEEMVTATMVINENED
ncbi:hypothetical protein EOPP23_17435 [Endozoicomonas sp. OPT23]|uniref:hypothetical protein n=1 Tax=Endozoicomonas sp. OPT23 TaxID=2072845 RepID=UPI00129B912D|nr:hypothetical protein [Endozoicomonas sp. OPT23]MRI34767.1 hypothetical protein [Endozoicomonas sp. OPT23]